MITTFFLREKLIVCNESIFLNYRKIYTPCLRLLFYVIPDEFFVGFFRKPVSLQTARTQREKQVIIPFFAIGYALPVALAFRNKNERSQFFAIRCGQGWCFFDLSARNMRADVFLVAFN